MIFIGFSVVSHKLSAKILCKHFRHCAPIIINNGKCVMYQFVDKNNIAKIPLKLRDIKILEHHGWKFIKYDGKFARTDVLKQKGIIITCVQFTKHFCGINKKTIQTPDALFRFLHK